MTKFTDGKRTIGLDMKTWDDSTNQYDIDWSADCFNVGGWEQDENGAYIADESVGGIDGIIDYANDWKRGIGDFCDDTSEEELNNREVFITEI